MQINLKFVRLFIFDSILSKLINFKWRKKIVNCKHMLFGIYFLYYLVFGVYSWRKRANHNSGFYCYMYHDRWFYPVFYLIFHFLCNCIFRVCLPKAPEALQRWNHTFFFLDVWWWGGGTHNLGLKILPPIHKYSISCFFLLEEKRGCLKNLIFRHMKNYNLIRKIKRNAI